MSDAIRCFGDSPIYIEYHDREWGRPVHDDRKLFEMLILEGAQAGLSWITVLKKREAYRAAFDDFDPVKVALYNETKIAELLANEGIIRNRLKINAAVINAKLFLDIQKQYGSVDRFIWGWRAFSPVSILLAIFMPTLIGEEPKKTFIYSEKSETEMMLIMFVQVTDIVFVNKSGIDSQYQREYGRAKAGIKVNGIKKGRKDKGTNVAAARYLWNNMIFCCRRQNALVSIPSWENMG